MECVAAAERRPATEVAIQLGAVASDQLLPASGNVGLPIPLLQSHRSRMEWPALLACREGEPPWLGVEQVGAGLVDWLR